MLIGTPYRRKLQSRRQLKTLLVMPVLMGALAASAAADETRGPGHVDAALKALVPPVDNAAACFVYQSKASRGDRIKSITFGVSVEHFTPDDKFAYGFDLRVRTARDRRAFSAGGECGWAYTPAPSSPDPTIRCSAECDGGTLTIRQDEAEGTLVLDLGTFRGERHLGCGSKGRTIPTREQPDGGFRLTQAPLAQCWPGKHAYKEVKP